MGLDEIRAACALYKLEIFGSFHPVTADLAPDGIQTIILLGPYEPGFWLMFTQSSEYLDGKPHPMDRWSKRVITRLSEDLGAFALFPFGEIPPRPFIRWAKASGRAFASPIGLLVHNKAGLMISYRGALGFAARLELPEISVTSPCQNCTEQPCRFACPVDAFASGGYDVERCKAVLAQAGNDCVAEGCAMRRACPLSQRYGRLAAQSAFHMNAFR